MDQLPDKPKSRRYRFEYRGTECLNCGHPLDMSDRYCPQCSQANSTKKLSLKDYLDEFFSSFISYDSRLLRTLGALLLRPGRITRDYINGKRVSYTNPFRFLLSLAIIYFLMLGVTGNFEEINRVSAQVDPSDFDLKGTLDTLQYENEDEKRQVMAALDSIILRNFGESARKRDSAIAANPASYFRSLDKGSFFDRYYGKQQFFQHQIKKAPLYVFGDAVREYPIPDTWENEFAFNSARSFVRIKQNPGDFLRTLISRLPFAVFFFLPVFALFIWLAYIRKRHSYTDHLIFGFYNTALLFILLIISFLIDTIFTVNSGWIFLTVFATYLFQAMRRFYGQGIFKTIVKYLFLNTVFFILSVFTILILFTGNMFIQ